MIREIGLEPNKGNFMIVKYASQNLSANGVDGGARIKLPLIKQRLHNCLDRSVYLLNRFACMVNIPQQLENISQQQNCSDITGRL